MLTLKKLGLTNDQISALGPDEIPFKDTGLAGRDNMTSVIDAQKQFYNDLELNYLKHYAQMDPMDKEVARIAEGKVDGQDPTEEGTSPSIRPEDMFKLPIDYNHWSKKK